MKLEDYIVQLKSHLYTASKEPTLICSSGGWVEKKKKSKYKQKIN